VPLDTIAANIKNNDMLARPLVIAIPHGNNNNDIS